MFVEVDFKKLEEASARRLTVPTSQFINFLVNSFKLKCGAKISHFLFLETFTSRVYEENTLSEAEICLTCFDKFRKYDRLMAEASDVQEDLLNLFNNSQSKLHDDFADEANNLQEECIVEEDENLFELVEVDTTEEDRTNDKKALINLYTCNTCNENFQKKRDYKAHIRIAHLPENAELFSCTECTEVFPSEQELLLHNAISHQTTDKFECPICRKVLSAKNLLVRHFNIHLSSRPYVCKLSHLNYLTVTKIIFP